MAHQEKITVTVHKDGSVMYKIEGVEGKSCETDDYTFLDSLGTPGERQYTSDYHKQGPGKGKLHVRR